MSDDLPSIGGKFEKEAQIKQKKANITILISLIIISGCFFYLQNREKWQNYPLVAYAKEKTFQARESSAEEMRKNFEEYRKGKMALPYVSAAANADLPGEFELGLRDYVKGYPIEKMVSAIKDYDQNTAALIIGIAKKESDWGKHAPSKNGADCHNYWGYKGIGSLGVSMGYGCFATPEEGVRAIGDKIKEITEKKNIQRPAEMISWKCGSSCASHSPESVQKWISDVNKCYYYILNIKA
jgi:hypothetical protein